mmetsp:Transcript_17306/g.29542  ORF Transcript_17306/g.29542 Transcript_17306/m.29542 type:complete len:569 (+) Transcript_17306:162-1868(+)
MLEEDLRPGFPCGMRVLVVDDDSLCLKVVEQMLRKCKYTATTCTNGSSALQILRERACDFDLVLSDVHMPDMDGFKLLETVGLELDLPVIMMSSNGETGTVLRGVTHGAVDFLIKPVRIEELRNLWQHVIRKPRREAQGKEDSEDHSHEQDEGRDEGREEGREHDYTRKRKDPRSELPPSQRGSLDEDMNASKRPRVTWTVELHQQFVAAVNMLGVDKAVPKKILEIMQADGLTRENVASHLQKYRLYLKRLVQEEPQGVGLQGASQAGSSRCTLPKALVVVSPPTVRPSSVLGGPSATGSLGMTSNAGGSFPASLFPLGGPSSLYPPGEPVNLFPLGGPGSLYPGASTSTPNMGAPPYSGGMLGPLGMMGPPIPNLHSLLGAAMSGQMGPGGLFPPGMPPGSYPMGLPGLGPLGMPHLNPLSYMPGMHMNQPGLHQGGPAQPSIPNLGMPQPHVQHEKRPRQHQHVSAPIIRSSSTHSDHAGHGQQAHGLDNLKTEMGLLIPLMHHQHGQVCPEQGDMGQMLHDMEGMGDLGGLDLGDPDCGPAGPPASGNEQGMDELLDYFLTPHD